VSGHVVLVSHSALLPVPNILQCVSAITGPKMTVLNVGRFGGYGVCDVPKHPTGFRVGQWRNATQRDALQSHRLRASRNSMRW
jgi:hypothetical protein